MCQICWIFLYLTLLKAHKKEVAELHFFLFRRGKLHINLKKQGGKCEIVFVLLNVKFWMHNDTRTAVPNF